MKNGLARFNYYIVQLEDLLLRASKEENPALWLYKNNARTPLFMLESLAKLYAEIHNSKRFTKIKEQFKVLEDGLGKIDYYDGFAKEFASNEQVPQEIKTYLEEQVVKQAANLNLVLTEDKWVGTKEQRLKKIWKKVTSADWQKPEKEINNIYACYLNAIEAINVFAIETSKGFTELENEVHSLRRKMRWLSIYPQALQGAVQLTDSKIEDQSMQSYLTPEVVNSSFNKMPAAGTNTHFLLLEKNYFLALSWMIGELGKLKDAGLRFYATAEAVEKTENKDQEAAMKRAMEILQAPADSIDKILKEASAITKKYFDAHYLEKIIHGVAAQSKK